MQEKIGSYGTVIETLGIAGLSVEHSIPTNKKFRYPIVLIHGMWGSGEVFHDLMDLLGSRGYECYSPSLRGHGGSKFVADLGKVSIEDYISDVEDFLLVVNEPVILIGHSMGEIIAAKVAERNKYGQVIAHIGMTSAPGRWMFMGMSTLLRMPKYLLKIIKGERFCLSKDDFKALLFNTAGPDELEKLLEKTCYESGTAAREITLWKYRMRRLTCPTLLIGALFDKITPYQRRVAKKLGAELVQVPCDHMLMLHKNVGSVMNEIDKWIRKRLVHGMIEDRFQIEKAVNG